MQDMLVKLYDLPDLAPFIARQREAGIEIRRAISPEKHIVVSWVREHFMEVWATETEIAFSNHPASLFVAVRDNQILGFACFDASYKNFFGPTGVLESNRGSGIGGALLMACLHAMRANGFGYAIIGAAGPIEYYRKMVNAIPIDGSWPGVYKGVLTK